MARELHDVIANHLSAVSIHATAAQAAGADQETVRAALADILTVCSASNQGTDNDTLPRSPASLDTTAGAGFDGVEAELAVLVGGHR